MGILHFNKGFEEMRGLVTQQFSYLHREKVNIKGAHSDASILLHGSLSFLKQAYLFIYFFLSSVPSILPS